MGQTNPGTWMHYQAAPGLLLRENRIFIEVGMSIADRMECYQESITFRNELSDAGWRDDQIARMMPHLKTALHHSRNHNPEPSAHYPAHGGYSYGLHVTSRLDRGDPEIILRRRVPRIAAKFFDEFSNLDLIPLLIKKSIGFDLSAPNSIAAEFLEEYRMYLCSSLLRFADLERDPEDYSDVTWLRKSYRYAQQFLRRS